MSLGGLEPPTFRLTAERANRLRHRDGTGEGDLKTIFESFTSLQNDEELAIDVQPHLGHHVDVLAHF